MTHSAKYELVKHYYNTWYNGQRMWNEDRVRNAVTKGWITAAEFEEITGNPYGGEA